MAVLELESVTCRIIEILERMAFVLAEPAEESLAELEPEWRCHAKINYGDSQNGGVAFLSATDGFLSELSSSMLGVEPEDIDLDEHGSNSLLELANVCAGELVILLGGKQDYYQLGLPEPVDAETPFEGEAGASNIEAVVASEDGILRVAVVSYGAAR